jgi:hypothetical protein
VSLKRGFYCCVLLAALLFNNAFASDFLPPGFRPVPPGVHALTGARIVIQPGEVLESGTVIIRDGLIEAVGANVALPADARVWDLKGATIYAGFIEPYLVLDSKAPISTSDTMPISAATLASGGLKFFGAPGPKTAADKPGYVLASITPDFRAAKHHSRHERAGRAHG